MQLIDEHHLAMNLKLIINGKPTLRESCGFFSLRIFVVHVLCYSINSKCFFIS